MAISLTGRRGRRWTSTASSRLDADRYLRLTLVSFAVSVLGTRAYLALTGYPQIGGETLHIAHALWGGLLLFIASLIPLLVVNRRALPTVAVLSGVGAGLFVDEVGKFITVDNDYFFPAAAPIAYAVFLLTVLVYLRVGHRPRHPGPHAQLHAALELLNSALDADLTATERSDLHRRLHGAATSPAAAPDLRRLATGLLDVLSSSTMHLAPARPGALRRLARHLEARAGGWLTERRLRLGLIAGLGVLGVLAVSDLGVITAISADLADGATTRVTDLANRFARVEIEDARGVAFLLARAALDVVAGLVLLAAALLLLRGRRRTATDLAQNALLLSLTVVNLLVFYLEQFAAAVGALIQLTLLQFVRYYQSHYAHQGQEPDVPAGTAGAPGT